MNRKCPCGHKFVARDRFVVKDGTIYCAIHFMALSETEVKLNKLMHDMNDDVG